MVGRDFAADDVIRVLVNVGNFWVDRVNGSHYILKWVHPDGVEKRTVSVPRHDRISVGTLQRIAEDAGANDFEAFCKWIDRNR